MQWRRCFKSNYDSFEKSSTRTKVVDKIACHADSRKRSGGTLCHLKLSKKTKEASTNCFKLANVLIYLVNEKKRFHSVGIARSRLSKFDQNEFGEI